MSNVINVTVGPLVTPSANNIALSQTPLAAGNLTLNGSLVSGGIATLDTARRVLITSAGNDSSISFTVYGADWSGLPISETLSGASGAPGSVYTTRDFTTVTQISVSGATASTVTVGTNNVASSRPINLDTFGFGPTSQQVVITGTITCGVENTLDDFIGFGEPPVVTYPNSTWVADAVLGTPATTGQSVLASIPVFTRITMTAGSGSARYTIIQPASPSI